MTWWGQRREAQLYLYPHKTSAPEGRVWSTPCPSHFPAGKESWYPVWRRLDEPWGRSGQVQKISHPPGLRSVCIHTHTIPHYKSVMWEWRYRSVISSFLAHSQQTVLKMHLLASSVLCICILVCKKQLENDKTHFCKIYTEEFTKNLVIYFNFG